MKMLRRFLLVIILPVLIISCSQIQINFGEIGIHLPYDKNDSSLEYKVTITGVNQNYYKAIYGSSGETFVIDDLDSGKYDVTYKAFDKENGVQLYSGETSAKVYVGIISPVGIELVSEE